MIYFGCPLRHLVGILGSYSYILAYLVIFCLYLCPITKKKRKISFPAPLIRSAVCLEDHVTAKQVVCVGYCERRRTVGLQMQQASAGSTGLFSAEFWSLFLLNVPLSIGFPRFLLSRHRALFFDMSVRRCLSIGGNLSAKKTPKNNTFLRRQTSSPVPRGALNKPRRPSAVSNLQPDICFLGHRSVVAHICFLPCSMRQRQTDGLLKVLSARQR